MLLQQGPRCQQTLMTANLVPAGQFEQLKAQLEDTQESLGAALARIEVFRLREKGLVAEIAKLRLGEQPDEAADTAENHAHADAATAQQQPAAGPAAEAAEAEPQPKWPIPCYVTEVEDNLPVLLFGNGGRKVSLASAYDLALHGGVAGCCKQSHGMIHLSPRQQLCCTTGHLLLSTNGLDVAVVCR